MSGEQPRPKGGHATGFHDLAIRTNWGTNAFSEESAELGRWCCEPVIDKRTNEEEEEQIEKRKKAKNGEAFASFKGIENHYRLVINCVNKSAHG
jgi:hypothetical protein